MKEPIDNIQWVNASDLIANAWNPNRVHKKELQLLEFSLLSTGWIQPILVKSNLIDESLLIIDGFHRWRLSQDSKKVKERWGGKVPVAMLDLDTPSAMLMTIRINRAKGTHVALNLSEIVRQLIETYGYAPEKIAKEMGANLDEVNLLAQDGVFAVRNIGKWAYSPAWYPVETK